MGALEEVFNTCTSSPSPPLHTSSPSYVRYVELPLLGPEGTQAPGSWVPNPATYMLTAEQVLSRTIPSSQCYQEAVLLYGQTVDGLLRKNDPLPTGTWTGTEYVPYPCHSP